jgi:hypothetical protein
MDQSEITMNACLGKNLYASFRFDIDTLSNSIKRNRSTGGAVFFRGVRETTFERNESFEFSHRVGGGNAIIVCQHKLRRSTNSTNFLARWTTLAWSSSFDKRSTLQLDLVGAILQLPFLTVRAILVDL